MQQHRLLSCFLLTFCLITLQAQSLTPPAGIFRLGIGEGGRVADFLLIRTSLALLSTGRPYPILVASFLKSMSPKNAKPIHCIGVLVIVSPMSPSMYSV